MPFMRKRGLSLEDQVLELAVQEFRARGFESRVEGTGDDTALTLLDPAGQESHTFMLKNTFDMARRTPPDEWPQLVAYRIGSVSDALSAPEPSDLTPEQLRAQIRTRLYPPEAGRSSYERVIAEGLALALTLDFPTTVVTLTDQNIEGIALPLDELYAVGQANTDREPIDDQFDLSENVSAFTGESLFVASRAANWTSLVPEVVGPAPLGVAFGVPSREVVFYSVLRHADWADQIRELAYRLSDYISDPRYTHPGGVVSDSIYYASPEGAISQLAFFANPQELVMIPDPGFERRFVSS
jgi:hypothetical protein